MGGVRVVAKMLSERPDTSSPAWRAGEGVCDPMKMERNLKTKKKVSVILEAGRLHVNFYSDWHVDALVAHEVFKTLYPNSYSYSYSL